MIIDLNQNQKYTKIWIDKPLRILLTKTTEKRKPRDSHPTALYTNP